MARTLYTYVRRETEREREREREREEWFRVVEGG